MEENKEKNKFVCWLNEEEKILSFHYEDEYIRKEFNLKADFQQFVLCAVYSGYKVQ